MYSWIPQPNSGRIGRSPKAVPRISRMLSSISRSWLTRAIPPVASLRSWKAQPAPMNSLFMPPPCLADQDVRDGRRDLARDDAAGRLRLRGCRRLAADRDGWAAAQHLADLHHREQERIRGVQADVGWRVVAGRANHRGGPAAGHHVSGEA